MQYILTQEEYNSLQRQDSKFDKLHMILHRIDVDLIDDTSKLMVFKKLISDLDYASQDGTIDAVLFAWDNCSIDLSDSNQPEIKFMY